MKITSTLSDSPIKQADTKKFIVGLTGGIGSGKTLVANHFAELGATVIDTDLIAHQLTAPNGAAISAIKAVFGESMLGEDGALDRAKMRHLVFSDSSSKQKLEALIHPLIRQHVAEQINKANGDYVIVVVPLLVERGNWEVARILVVDCAEETQIKRVMKRNNFDKELIKSIMAHQATRSQRLAAAHDVVLNVGEFSETIPQIHQLHQLYLSLAKAP